MGFERTDSYVFIEASDVLFPIFIGFQFTPSLPIGIIGGDLAYGP